MGWPRQLFSRRPVAAVAKFVGTNLAAASIWYAAGEGSCSICA